MENLLDVELLLPQMLLVQTMLYDRIYKYRRKEMLARSQQKFFLLLPWWHFLNWTLQSNLTNWPKISLLILLWWNVRFWMRGLVIIGTLLNTQMTGNFKLQLVCTLITWWFLYVPPEFSSNCLTCQIQKSYRNQSFSRVARFMPFIAKAPEIPKNHF